MRVIKWIKVMRLQTALVTALALWAGHITVKPLTIESAWFLGLIGLFTHVWGFLFNNVCDAEYDKKHGEGDNLISKGEIDKEIAWLTSWLAACLAIILFLVASNSLKGFITFIFSFFAGYIYDVRSKKDWWSNGYLSAWVFFMVLTGAYYVGSTSKYAGIVAIILSIQVFTQVIEGDLKDINGPEATFAEKLGVRMGEYQHGVPKLIFTKKFKSFVYSFKTVEVFLIAYIAFDTFSANSVIVGGMWLGISLFMLLVFFASLDGWMFSVLNETGRSRIKKMASVHEISSITLIGLGLMWIDLYGALLIMLGPPLWYIIVNNVIHSSSLNPDI